MDILYSILLCPIFFILLYAINECWFPTRNGAMLFSIFMAIIFSIIYYTLKKQIRQYHIEKGKKEHSKRKRKNGLMLLSDESFSSLFEYPYVVADNSFEGLKEEKLLQILRQYGCNKKYDFFLLNGMKPGCADLLAILNVSYVMHSEEEILSVAEKTVLPEYADRDLPKKSRLGTVLKSREFAVFGIKYGMTLLLISLITPYKTFYIVLGMSLLLYGILILCARHLKINRQNRIPNR